MNETKRNYRKKLKSKLITFYLHEKELYEFANAINFQQFVKTCLKCEIIDKKMIENADVVISLNEEDYL